MILDNGEIAELGTHEELMARNGAYRRIYETQFLGRSLEIVSTEVGRE